MSILRNDDGSTMVEMAIIYPLIIAVIMVLIYLMINIYSAASLQSSLHMQVRTESATRNELAEVSINGTNFIDRYRAKAESINIPLVDEKDYVYASVGRDYRGNAMIKSSTYRKEYGRAYLIDEADYYRKWR